MKHLVITGTGRAGTTFLLQLLTRLGLDTGFSYDFQMLPANKEARMSNLEFYPEARAGLELNISHPDAPYIVKTPFLCDTLDDVIASGVVIDHAIVPVREFNAAAASRVFVQKETTGTENGSAVPGGLWDTDSADNQVEVLRFKFTNLIESLVRHDIPITFLSYPRLARDPDYLYEKLRFLVSDPVAFRSAFDGLVRPEWVHDFTSPHS